MWDTHVGHGVPASWLGRGGCSQGPGSLPVPTLEKEALCTLLVGKDPSLYVNRRALRVSVSFQNIPVRHGHCVLA